MKTIPSLVLLDNSFKIMNVETFDSRNFEEPEMGLVLAENDDWVLVKHIPAEYIVDGFKLYRKRFLSARKAAEEEMKVARVLQLKKESTELPGFEFAAPAEMLKWIEEEYGVFEFHDEEEMEVFYGRVFKVQNGLLTLEMVDADGNSDVDEDQDHVLERISMISFGSDYLYSLTLLWNDNKSRKNGSH